MGGLARKATIVDQSKVQNKNLLVVDAGNLYFKQSKVNEIEKDKLKITAQVIRDSYNAIGCNAFSPGEKDFAAGLEYLLELESGSNFPYISANIFNLSGNQIFKSYEIIELNGKKIALIGLTSSFNNPALLIKEPISVLDNVLKEIYLNHNTDLNILLFHSNSVDINKLHLKNFPIDLVIQSKDHKLASNGGKNETPVFSCGSRGKYLYTFNINIEDNSSGIIDLSLYENKITLSNKKLKRLKKGNFDLSLEQIYLDNPSKLQEIKKLKETIYTSKKVIENTKNTLKFEKIELNKKVADRPDILKIIDDGKALINEVVGPQPEIPFNSHSHPHPHISPRSN